LTLACLWGNTPATKTGKNPEETSEETAMATGTTTSATPAKKKTAKTTTATSAKTKTTTTKTRAAVATASRPSRSNGASKSRRINPDQRRNYIEVAAYYIAERRGFSGGHEAEDWVTAEVEIDRLLAEGKLNG
jgi:hypothetical protein